MNQKVADDSVRSMVKFSYGWSRMDRGRESI